MADNTGRIPGTFSLPQIEGAIKYEEAGSFEFLTSNIENNKDNLADFKELPLGDMPKDLKLTVDTDPDPSGYRIFPNSPIPMMVDGSKKNVKVWRQQ